MSKNTQLGPFNCVLKKKFKNGCLTELLPLKFPVLDFDVVKDSLIFAFENINEFFIIKVQ
jgi:hypothetical protein